MNDHQQIGTAARYGHGWSVRVARMLVIIMVPLLFCGEVMAEVRYHHDINNRKCCLVIAHAGGGIEGNPYTNSEEALLANLKDGVRIFELDFARTLDGRWVCTHDWGLWKSQTLFEGTLPPDYAEFTARSLSVQGYGAVPFRYKPITLPFLESILSRYNNIILISDTKYRLRELALALKDSRIFQRIYPQAYSTRDVEMLAGMGYRKIILTLYRMDLAHPEKVIPQVASVAEKLHAVTVPMGFFAQHHKSLVGMGVPIYVHGPPASINSRELHARFMRLGAAGFYVD